jgi:hypothetical protein
MARTYIHHFTGDGCEAEGCRIRTRSLWGASDGTLIRACCPAHAKDAERQQARRHAAARRVGWR